MVEEYPEVPPWDLAPGIKPYKGIRVDGTEIRPTYGFKDYWGRMHCKPWYTVEEAQTAANEQKAIDEAGV